MMSQLTGAIAKRLPHAKNQLSTPGSFFNQFVTDRYIRLRLIGSHIYTGKPPKAAPPRSGIIPFHRLIFLY